MPRVSVFQCPDSKKLFREAVDYRRHLCQKNFQRKLDRRRLYATENAATILAELRRMTDFETIAIWLMENAKYLRGMNPDFRGKKPRYVKSLSLTNVVFENMRWDDGIPNNHHCPLGKRTSYGGFVADRKYYPGYRGTIRFKLTGYEGSCDLFRKTGLITGCGGGGDRLYSYEVFLFAEDWPNMAMMKNLCA